MERARSSYLSIELYEDGVIAAPASGTVTVYNASNVKVVDADAVTITSSIANFTLLASAVATESFGAGWRVEWELVMGDGYTHVERQDAALVRVRLAPTIAPPDILARRRQLVSSGYVTVAQLADSIEEAFREMCLRLEDSGRKPHLIVNPSGTRMHLLFSTLAIVCGDLAGTGDPENKWRVLAQEYERRAEHEWTTMRLLYDSDDDGAADGSHRTGMAASIWLTA
jgi:hypothetical protein